MAGVACYVCNFNGKEYAEKCIASVLEQRGSGTDFDLYLVDNASTDGSVEQIRKVFGDELGIICNEVNRGGAGGFNTALKDAVQKKYEYVILLDNDITLADRCISNMVEYMDAHDDVGCVGAKIMMMDHPEYLQEFGVHLDFERYGLRHDYWFELDRGTEEAIESDCVASCALAARVSCLDRTGLFPEENFLYWDDLEFTYQIRLAGFRVVSLASAVAYHKGKKKPGTSTAPGYYGMRNRIRFFARYEREERLPQLCRIILEEYFQFFFGSASKGFHASNSSRMFALDDFVHKKYGRVDPQKVYPMDEREDRVKALTADAETVYLDLREAGSPALMEAAGAFCRRMDEIGTVKRVAAIVSGEDGAEDIAAKLERYYEKPVEFTREYPGEALVFRPCGHIKDVREDIRPAVWFDRYLNCAEDEADYERIRAYPHLCDFFVRTHYEWIMQGILAERRRQ